MSTSTYEGWRVPTNIINVAKDNRIWKDGKYICVDTPQGYVVDPDNKKMLETALSWAKWTEYKGEFNKETRRYDEQIDHIGEVHEFNNEGFTLTLLDSANSSSQGGKLSFWNCLIAKDDKEFIIGIASDYLLEILLHNDFINGACQSTLSFARCKGGVGMMNKDMPSYQQFLQDELHRAAMKKGKTKKREPGHLYSTLTGGDVYFSTFYRWYEPVLEDRGYYYNKRLIGFKKLASPVALYWQPWYDEELNKKSEYFSRSFYLSESTPARTDSGVVAEIDITDDEILDKHFEKLFKYITTGNYSLGAFCNSFGLSTSKDSYEMPDYIRSFIIERGYKVWD
jgi:hypothetical protein